MQYTPINELTLQRDAVLGRAQSLMNQARSIIGRAKAEDRDLNEREQQQFDRLQLDADKHLNEGETIKAEIASAMECGADPNYTGDVGRTATPMQPRASPSAIGAPAIHIPKTGQFADLFKGADMTRGKEFSCLGEFALTVASGRPDQRLMNSAMSEGVGVSAGFLVPSQFIAGVLDGALAQEVIRPNARVFPMQSNELDLAGFDYADGTSSKRAGLELSWGAEHGILAEQTATARKITMKARKATILCRVSSELAEDVPAFDRQLSTAMSAAVAAGLDSAFVNGTGAGLPLGIINSPAAIVVAKESAQAANTLLIQNLSACLARLQPSAFARSTWLVHPTVIPKLMTLAFQVLNVAGTESVGAAGSGAVTHGSDGQLRIFGRPCLVSDACSVLSVAGDVILADLSQYAIGLRRDASIEVARDTYFTTDEIGFKLRLRLDGQPLAAAPTKLRDGSNTVSPFVILGAR